MNWASALLAALMVAIAAQGGDQATGKATGARLAGRIVTDDLQQTPIRGALVLVSDDLGRPRRTVTDDAGTFEFNSLPASWYTVSASKPSYVAMAYGASRPDRPGIAVAVSADQSIRNVLIRLPRGAVVTGTLRDQSGETMSDVSVTAIRMNPADGQAASSPSTHTGVTDDRGVYRIYGLPPGRYLIAATVRTSGVAGAIAAPSADDVDRVFAEIRRSQLLGVSRAAATGAATVPAPLLPTVVFAPTFFPGTAFAGDAEIMVLASGDLRSADFTVLPSRTGSIEGVIQTHDGSSVPPVVPTLYAAGPQVPRPFATRPALVIGPGRDGRFKFEGVLPGTYTLSLAAAAARGAGPGSRLWGRTNVVFSGADVTGVTLTLRPGLRVAGRVAFEGSALRPALSTIQVTLTSLPDDAGAFMPSASARTDKMSASANADGTFTITDLPPQTYAVSARVSGPWWLRSAVIDGRDALDTMLEIRAADIAGAVLIFSDRHSELSGNLQTSANTQAAGYFVVAFPMDSSLWRRGSRRIRSVRLATDGRFAFRDLPAGEYCLAALTDVGEDDLVDPSFLSELVPASVKITLADGESKTQNLRIAGTQDGSGVLRRLGQPALAPKLRDIRLRDNLFPGRPQGEKTPNEWLPAATPRRLLGPSGTRETD